MKATDIWMPLFIGDILRDTLHLSSDHLGKYLLLLMASWPRPDCSVPDDDSQLATITRTDADKWPEFRKVLGPFFSISDGKWIHPRLLKEKILAIKRSEVRVKVGKLGGRPKKPTEQKPIGLPIAKPDGYSDAKQNETPSPSPSHKGTDVHTHARANGQKTETTVEGLKRRINAHFRRPDTSRWSDFEEHTLFDISKREGVLSEWNEIAAYCKRKPEYSPRKVHTMLEGWTGTLDCARRKEDPSSDVQKTPAWKRMQILVDKISKHPANHESAFHNRNCTEAQKEELKQLRAELRKLEELR